MPSILTLKKVVFIFSELRLTLQIQGLTGNLKQIQQEHVELARKIKNYQTETPKMQVKYKRRFLGLTDLVSLEIK